MTHLDPEPDANDAADIDIEELRKRIETIDPYEERLKPITKDKKIKGGLSPWVIRLCGESATFANPNPNPALAKINYGVVVVKSL